MINKLFYIIYNSYYKHGAYKNDIPTLTVGAIFGVFFLSIGYSSLIVFGWINPMYYNLPKLSKAILSLITLLFGIIVYFVFYHEKKYQRIYIKYKEDTFLNSKSGKVFGFFFVLIIIVSPIILALARNKICAGYWV